MSHQIKVTIRKHGQPAHELKMNISKAEPFTAENVDRITTHLTEFLLIEMGEVPIMPDPETGKPIVNPLYAAKYGDPIERLKSQ